MKELISTLTTQLLISVLPSIFCCYFVALWFFQKQNAINLYGELGSISPTSYGPGEQEQKIHEVYWCLMKHGFALPAKVRKERNCLLALQFSDLKSSKASLKAQWLDSCLRFQKSLGDYLGRESGHNS